MTEPKELVDDISSVFVDAPKLHKLENNKTARLKIGYMKSLAREEEGVTVGFHFGSVETTQKICDIIEPKLDKRKFKVSTNQPKYKQNKSWTVGWVDVDNNGNIVEYNIKEEYLKPKKR